jgi:FixJ family two-component response regulator
VTEGKAVIAVVDDDIRVLESLEELLESAGHRVLSFTGVAAFLAVERSCVDCLLTDIGMPGTDGFELLEIVKRSNPGLPVFLITGRHEIADQRRAAAKNISGFFRKPFDAQLLLSEVSRALRDIKKEDKDAD